MLDKILANLKRQSWIKLLLQKSNVYIVGGCVRDAYLNIPIKDVDLVIEGISMDEIQNLLGDYGKLSIVGESFKVIKFRPTGHVGEDYDIAVPRKDRKVGIGHKGIEATEALNIFEDLKRRDFTVNSCAINIGTGQVLNPFNGLEDLKRKVLKATDNTAFTEDALRILRAIQFAARFRFDIEPNTLKMMRDNAHLLKEITGERILMELDKILQKNGSTKIAFELLEKANIDKVLFGQKFFKDGFEYFDNLDAVSFYYVLGNLGNTKSSEFYKTRLKGEAPMTKALQTIEKYFTNFGTTELEIKWNVFQMLRISPQLKDAVVLPENVSKVIDEMKAGKIPMKMGDIPVTGNDIMDKFTVTGTEVGNIINFMYQEALMNKFEWKSKEKTLKYLQNI